LGLLISLLIEGRLTPQTFAIGCVIVMALAAAIWTVLLKKSDRPIEIAERASSASARNDSKKKAIQIAILLLFLVVVLWMTRGGPWIPRLIGAFMLLLFTTGVALRKTN
jgi:hypothetical protein